MALGLLPGCMTYFTDKQRIVRHISSPQFIRQQHVVEALNVLQALLEEFNEGRAYHSRPDAICAPSTMAASFAHVISGSTSSEPAKVAKPQSVPAMTFSRPTTEA